VAINIKRERLIEMLNGEKMQALLDVKAEEAERVAKGLWEARRLHLDRHVPEYGQSFFVRRRRKVTSRGESVPSRQIGNSSGRWLWVEFGAHAGGKTPVLHYRILGLTLDTLAASG
jgi:hypothetical protein